jgi:hypothetical protein
MACKFIGRHSLASVAELEGATRGLEAEEDHLALAAVLLATAWYGYVGLYSLVSAGEVAQVVWEVRANGGSQHLCLGMVQGPLPSSSEDRGRRLTGLGGPGAGGAGWSCHSSFFPPDGPTGAGGLAPRP